jgi:hypothetical protein
MTIPQLDLSSCFPLSGIVLLANSTSSQDSIEMFNEQDLRFNPLVRKKIFNHEYIPLNNTLIPGCLIHEYSKELGIHQKYRMN